MEYNDFAMPDDYSQMAKAYYSSMKKRGFVFFRLDDTQEQKLKICNQIASLFNETLENYTKAIKRLRSTELILIKRLYELTAKQQAQFSKEYMFEKYNVQTHSEKQNFLSQETKLLKNIFELYKLEDDEKKKFMLSSFIENRLDIFN